MVNVFLIVSAAVLSVVIAISVTFLIIRFGHPDDKNEAKFPKFIAGSALFLACAAVMALPFDVTNVGDTGGLNVGLLWQIIFIVAAVYILLVIPYAFFFYESDTDPEDAEAVGCNSQSGQACKMTAMLFVIFMLVLVLLYAFVSEAEIEIVRSTQNMFTVVPAGAAVPQAALEVTGCSTRQVEDINQIYFQTDTTAAERQLCHQDTHQWNLTVTFPIYTIALLSLIGWFLFALFVGVGLFALPLDLLNDFQTRPMRMTMEEYTRKKQELGLRARSLREQGEEMIQEMIESMGEKRKRKERRTAKKAQKNLEQSVYLLRKDIDFADLSFHLKGGNPLWPWFKLFLSIIGSVLSLLWVIHIFVFMLLEAHPFLNEFLVDITIDGFPLFGVTVFSVLSFYLLWCCVAGNFKLGLQIPFVIKLYPMEIGNTMTNAFLVNTWVILVCCIPCVQFCVEAFPIYASGTDIHVIFGNQVRNLRGFREVFASNGFVIAIVVLALLTALASLFLAKSNAATIERQLKEFSKTGKKPVNTSLGFNKM